MKRRSLPPLWLVRLAIALAKFTTANAVLVISSTLGAALVIGMLVSSAETTARAVFARLVDDGVLAHTAVPAHRFAATGEPREFARLAARFLGPRLRDVDVEHVATAAL